MKKIHQPIKPFIVNQYFGENNACVDIKTRRKVRTCDGNKPPRGYKSLYGPKGHQGMDLKAHRGQELYAAAGGKVYHIDTQERSGLDVRIESKIGVHRYQHIYEHMQGIQVEVGDIVPTGKLIGWADNTGYSSGDHLHFEVRKYVKGKWIPVDPLEIMSDEYAKDVLARQHTLQYALEQLSIVLDSLASYLRSRGIKK